MAKKYTNKEVSEILRIVLIGAFEHLEAIKKEIRSIGPVDENSDPSTLARAKVMHLTMVCINDIIHPAHKLCYSLFPETNHEFFDLLVSSYALAKEKKGVPECFCVTCDPKAIKYQEKIKEIEALKEKRDAQKVAQSGSGN